MSKAEKIIDYATGKEVRKRPEEEYRQQFEHILIDDLGYPPEHIDIEFPIQRGSSKQSEAADIVVFHDTKHTQDNIYIVIEIKIPGKKYDMQAISYTTATTASYVTWFSGFERNSDGPYYFYRDLKNAPTKFLEIPTLPRFGETQETIGRYRKSDLKPAKALRVLFSRLHHKLYGSAPIKREENVAIEIIKLLFCKIFDELSPEELCEFRVTPSEIQTQDGQLAVKERINNIYRQLLLDPDFGEMFADQQLEYDEYWISYIVFELQGIALLHEETNTDALGDAYEVFLPSALKGESGQFFTPREVVRFAVDVVAPSFQKKEIIFDPACGSGGFLSVAIENLRKQINTLYAKRGFTKDRLASILRDHAGKYIHGCDIEPLLHRIAKSYMAIIGDGRSNIYLCDSLLPTERLPKGFRRKIKFNNVDVIMTNPPFGTKIDDVRSFVLEQFDIGHRIKNGKPTQELLAGQDPDKLFLERAIQYLKVGGRMVIVLPKQNLSGAQNSIVQIRKWLLNKVKITAVVDLPREAFQPHTGTKTSLVFIEKVANPKTDYTIFMAVSEAVGHDRRGNPVYIKNEQGHILTDESGKSVIWNDLPKIYTEWIHYQRGRELSSKSPSCFIIKSSALRKDRLHRLDAWYWDPNKNELAKQIEEAVGESIIGIDRLGDLTIDGGIFYPNRHKRNYVESSDNSLPFYSGTQILQVRPFDLKYQPKNYKPAGHSVVEKDWILITRSGSTGRVVIVNEQIANTMVSEHVIRVICDEELVDPYYVYALLASNKIGKGLMEKGIYASVVDHLTPGFIASLPIPRLKSEAEEKIAASMREAEKYRANANKLFFKNIEKIENSIFDAILEINNNE